jgi:hypothetical protein
MIDEVRQGVDLLVAGLGTNQCDITLARFC